MPNATRPDPDNASLDSTWPTLRAIVDKLVAAGDEEPDVDGLLELLCVFSFFSQVCTLRLCLIIYRSRTASGKVPQAHKHRKTTFSFPSPVLALQDSLSTLDRVRQLLDNAVITVRRKVQYTTPHGLLALPEDTLAIILMFACKKHLGQRRLRRALKLCAVCRTLREVAINIPSLWSTIVAPSSNVIAPELLARSRRTPLQVIAAHWGVLNNERLLAEAYRWESLEFPSRIRRAPWTDSTIISTTVLPSLVELKLRRGQVMDIFSMFPMPNLRHVMLDDSSVHAIPDTSSRCLTTCQIRTEFTARRIGFPGAIANPLDALLASLAELKMLTTLTLDFTFMETLAPGALALDRWERTRCYRFPSVQKLTLEITHNMQFPIDEGPFLLLRMDMPLLISMDISYDQWTMNHQNDVNDARVESQPSEIFVGGQLSRWLTFADTLHAPGRMYPHLREFRYSHTGTASPIRILPGVLPLMPRLEVLYLQGWIDPAFTESAAAALNHLPPLREVQLHESRCNAYELEHLIDDLQRHHPCWDSFEALILSDFPSHRLSGEELQTLHAILPERLSIWEPYEDDTVEWY